MDLTMYFIYALIFRLAIIATGALSIYLGYMLFVKGVFGGTQDADLSAEISGTKFSLKNAAPGTFFALFGVVIITVMLTQGMPMYDKTSSSMQAVNPVVSALPATSGAAIEVSAADSSIDLIQRQTKVLGNEPAGAETQSLALELGKQRGKLKDAELKITELSKELSSKNIAIVQLTESSMARGSLYENDYNYATEKMNQEHYDKAIKALLESKEFKKGLALLHNCYEKEGKSDHQQAVAFLMNE